jgi:hypothetical protein
MQKLIASPAQTKPITAIFYSLKVLDLNHVIGLSTNTFDIASISAKELVGQGYFHDSRIIQLSINFGSRREGAFKYAYFGTSSVAISPADIQVDSDQTEHICAKVCFNPDTKLHWSPNEQLPKLLMELRCLTWAYALMSLVYAFIDQFQKDSGQRTLIDVPRVRFVAAGLAIGQTSKDKGQLFLIEEQIAGKFIKYINNGTASISSMKYQDSRSRNLAEFFAFCQHVQYMKTKKLVFISDFQGTCCSTHQDSVINLL